MLTAAPGVESSNPPTRHLCQHGWGVRRRPPSGHRGWSGTPTPQTFHTFVIGDEDELRLVHKQTNEISTGSAQVGVLLISGVVVAHPLRISDHCGVVTRDL